jgi:hypothetical protein
MINPFQYAPPKSVYLNPKQQAFLASQAKKKVWIGGRGTGKTTVGGVAQWEKAIKMPRSKGFILGLTYNQILTKFLPPMIEMWERLGMKEHEGSSNPGHFVIGKKPPSNWATPFQSPRKYDNTISFFTGRCIELLSFERNNSSIGGSYDDAMIDEAVLIDKERHDKEIRPMIRGNIFRFADNHLHQQRIYVSSQSWLQKGYWVPDMAKEVDPKDSLKTFYLESTTHDNIDVLGKDYLAALKRDLPYWTYQVEVLNRRLNKLPDGFYDEFNEDRHLYFDSFYYDQDEHGRMVTKGDRDYNDKLPLEISFDFGARFTCMTVHQEDRDEYGQTVERVINSFYRKRDRTTPEGRSLIEAVLDDFVQYYGKHRNLLKIWGDRNGNSLQANSRYTYYQEIEKKLKEKGYTTKLCVTGLDAAHQVKHYLINRMLSEADKELPIIRINQNRCKNLIVSIQNAPVLPDFKKDKSSERQEIAQETATHFSDAFDAYFYHKYGKNVGKTDTKREDPMFI